jgi:hypothetical protein
MIWVLITKASASTSIHNPSGNYLDLKQFDSLIDAVNYGLEQYPEIIIVDPKRMKEYDLYKEDIEDRNLKFVEYDYHIIIYDGYIE